MEKPYKSVDKLSKEILEKLYTTLYFCILHILKHDSSQSISEQCFSNQGQL